MWGGGLYRFRAGIKEKELLEKITVADPKDKRHCIRVLTRSNTGTTYASSSSL